MFRCGSITPQIMNEVFDDVGFSVFAKPDCIKWMPEDGNDIINSFILEL